MLLSLPEFGVIILCIICLVLAVWQKTVVFSGLCAVVNAIALYMGFVVLHYHVLFFPVPAVLTIVSLFMALAEAIDGEVL